MKWIRKIFKSKKHYFYVPTPWGNLGLTKKQTKRYLEITDEMIKDGKLHIVKDKSGSFVTYDSEQIVTAAIIAKCEGDLKREMDS